MSHEVMHDVTTETLVPAGVTERDGTASGTARVAVGVGPVSRASVVAVARDGAGVELTAEAVEAIAASRAVVEALADDRTRTTASRPASARWPPGTSRPSCGPSCSAAWSARTPPASGPEVEREVVRALMLLRLSTLATGRTGVRPETAQALRRAAQRRASPRSCTSTARWAAPATSRRWRTARSR